MEENCMQAVPEMIELEAQTDLPSVAEAQTETPQAIENQAQTDAPCVAEAQTETPQSIDNEAQTSSPSVAEVQTETPQSIDNEAQTNKVIKKDKGVHVHLSEVQTKDSFTTMQTTRIRTGGGYHIVEGPDDGSANALAKTWSQGVSPSPLNDRYAFGEVEPERMQEYTTGSYDATRMPRGSNTVYRVLHSRHQRNSLPSMLPSMDIPAERRKSDVYIYTGEGSSGVQGQGSGHGRRPSSMEANPRKSSKDEWTAQWTKATRQPDDWKRFR